MRVLFVFPDASSTVAHSSGTLPYGVGAPAAHVATPASAEG